MLNIVFRCHAGCGNTFMKDISSDCIEFPEPVWEKPHLHQGIADNRVRDPREIERELIDLHSVSFYFF